MANLPANGDERRRSQPPRHPPALAARGAPGTHSSTQSRTRLTIFSLFSRVFFLACVSGTGGERARGTLRALRSRGAALHAPTLARLDLGMVTEDTDHATASRIALVVRRQRKTADASQNQKRKTLVVHDGTTVHPSAQAKLCVYGILSHSRSLSLYAAYSSGVLRFKS